MRVSRFASSITFTLAVAGLHLRRGVRRVAAGACRPGRGQPAG